MAPITIYFLKVSVAIALVTLPYILFLRGDSNLVIKRFYLLGGLLLSWIFPLISISRPELIPQAGQAFFIDPAMTIPSDTRTMADTGSSFSTAMILPLLYIIGTISLLMVQVVSYFRVSKGNQVIDENFKYYHTSSNKVFTLFRKIFVPDQYKSEPELDSILIHERAHIRQLHILDLLLSEISLLLTWFNPFSWLISRMIKENHEHLADREVLSRGVNPAHYKALLLNHAVGGEVFRLGHRFNHSLTKKRFNMMKKMKASRIGSAKYILFIPAVFLFTLLVTSSTQGPKNISGKICLESTEMPATGASIVIAGGTHGTVVDRQGNFKLQVEGNPDLVVSFVGYKSEKVPAKKLDGGTLIMVPSVFEIPLDRLQESAQAGIHKHETIHEKHTEERQEEATDESGQKEVFYIVEDIPSFPGGMYALASFLEKNVIYPDEAKKNALTGEVYVQFTVGTSGKVKDAVITRSTNKVFDKPALNAISQMPDWNPGKQRGKPVSCKVIVPVRFESGQE